MNRTLKVEKKVYRSLVLLALGSNIGDRKRNVIEAIMRLPITNKVSASLYETKALAAKKYFLRCNRNYINTVVCGYCSIAALELLRQIKLIEYSMNRKNSLKWASRRIDIDIIFYKGLSVNHCKLTIPHEEAKNRDFVLIPIGDICGFSVDL